MNHFGWIKKFGKTFLWSFGILFLFTFILTTLHYFNIIPNSFVTIGKLVIPIFCFFLGGFLMSKNQKEKGWLEGLKVGILFLILFVLSAFFFFHNSFSIENWIYDLILLISSTFGGMIGINFSSN